ncbi:MAG: HD domain-containing phosphohydrolase [Candidatus Baltobacteraceae bacterium]
MNVAVVDDQESSLSGFSQILRRIAEMEPVCFKKATDALHWLAGVDPVFVVVSHTIEGGNGLDFIRRMRLVDGRAATPVVFTTASKNARDLRRTAFDLDVFAYLEKPINPSEFLVHAMHIVDAYREREEFRARLEELGKRTSTGTPTAGSNDTVLAIEAMLDVAAMHDPAIVTHLNLASQLSVALARELKLTDEEIDAIAVASRIYDIGKVAIPQRVAELRGQAGSADRVSIEAHAQAGARILTKRQTPIMRTATIMAQTHHERFDGTGYPRKLHGAQIPIFGRIVAVADTLSALLQTRPHRPALSLAKALEIIESQSGAAFDPTIVAAARTGLGEISRIVHEHFGRAAS